MSNTDLAQFGKIDQTGDPAHFVSFLDAACRRGVVQGLQTAVDGVDALLRRRGAGRGLRHRRRRAQDGGRRRVAGPWSAWTTASAMIEEAKRRAAAMSNVEFVSAEATALPFPDGSFDATRADRSLMHVPDGAGDAEMARRTRPGGRVVVFEVDFETAMIDVEDRVLRARSSTRGATASATAGWGGACRGCSPSWG